MSNYLTYATDVVSVIWAQAAQKLDFHIRLSNLNSIGGSSTSLRRLPSKRLPAGAKII